MPAGLSTTASRTPVLLGATRKVVPTSRLPRLRIQTGTAGSSRRSRRVFPTANGNRKRARTFASAASHSGPRPDRASQTVVVGEYLGASHGVGYLISQS